MRKLMTLCLVVAGLVGACLAGGCAYTYKNRLPNDIKTIEVNTFANTTYYLSLEGPLTRNVIDRINLTPGVKVVNSKGDATLTGEIYDVRKITTSYDSNNQPQTQTITISVKFQLIDNRSGEVVLNSTVTSAQDSSSAGVYRLDQGQNWTQARDAAVRQLASEIARRLNKEW